MGQENFFIITPDILILITTTRLALHVQRNCQSLQSHNFPIFFRLNTSLCSRKVVSSVVYFFEYFNETSSMLKSCKVPYAYSSLDTS